MSRQGNIQFSMIFTVPSELVSEGDRIFNSHAKWMERTHYRDGDKALLVYDLSKAPEMEYPMDPNSVPTGNTHFVLCEIYKSPEGLTDHWQQAENSWEDFDALKAWMSKGNFLLVNGAKVVHSIC